MLSTYYVQGLILNGLRVLSFLTLLMAQRGRARYNFFLCMMQLKNREVNEVAQDHIAGKWLSLYFIPGKPNPSFLNKIINSLWAVLKHFTFVFSPLSASDAYS